MRIIQQKVLTALVPEGCLNICFYHLFIPAKFLPAHQQRPLQSVVGVEAGIIAESISLSLPCQFCQSGKIF